MLLQVLPMLLWFANPGMYMHDNHCLLSRNYNCNTSFDAKVLQVES